MFCAGIVAAIRYNHYFYSLMRILFLIAIAFAFLSPEIVHGQKPKTKKSAPKKTIIRTPPPPPPPPPPPMDEGQMGNQGSGSGTGFQLLKIPVNGDYFLGMLKAEYDTLSGRSELITSVTSYPVELSPWFFYNKRLSKLTLSSKSEYAGDLTDIIAKYESRYGVPEERQVIDTTEIYKLPNDSLQTGQRKLRQLSSRWTTKYCSIVFTAKLYPQEPTGWKGSFRVQFEGSTLYTDMLYQLTEKERQREGGY